MIILDEYIEQLQRELVDPKPYEFDGMYHYRGEEHAHYGKILLGKNMNFAGEIRDPNSSCPRHAVKGKISFDDKLVRMDFMKIPPGFLVPIYYSLGKPKNNEIIGNYEGMWAFQEKGIILKIGYKPGIGEAVIVEQPEQINRSSLMLYKKIIALL